PWPRRAPPAGRRPVASHSSWRVGRIWPAGRSGSGNSGRGVTRPLHSPSGADWVLPAVGLSLPVEASRLPAEDWGWLLAASRRSGLVARTALRTERPDWARPMRDFGRLAAARPAALPFVCVT